MSEVTCILSAIESGDAHAADKLLPLVYEELRKLARGRLARELPGQTLQATDLVHEAYVRLVGIHPAPAPKWQSRGHFFAAAAEAMRRILIDRARAGRAQKRGGRSRKRINLEAVDLQVDLVPAELIDLDIALQKLAAEDPTKAELVKLRYFAGLSLREAAELLDISCTTADQYWAYARAWLYHEMTSGWTELEE